MKTPKIVWQTLIGSGFTGLVGLILLAGASSWPRSGRLIPIIGGLLAGAGAAYVAGRGEDPAYRHQVDRIADISCFEAERENALEEIQEEDDIRRELNRYERQIQIEAEGMQRTLPLQMQLQQMKAMLTPYPMAYPPGYVQPMGMGYPPDPNQAAPNLPPGVPAAPQYTTMPPGQPIVPGGAPAAPQGVTAWFDFSRLQNIDEYPVLVVIGGMGAGKSKMLKWLNKSYFGAEDMRACDPYARSNDWPNAKQYPEAADIYTMMVEDLAAIELEKEEYRAGKSDWVERLTVIEEAPDTFLELRQHQQTKNQSLPRGARRDSVGDWLIKHFTLTRKLRRRVALVSVSMSATEFIAAEHRSKAVVLFPGTAIDEVMADTQYFKLGTIANGKLREQLRTQLAQVKNPCLIYFRGQWQAGAMPDLTLEGDIISAMDHPYPGYAVPPAPAESEADRLNRLLGMDFPEEESDR